MPIFTILVDVNPTSGDFLYNPSTLRIVNVTAAQIIFSSPHDFAITFLDDTPIGTMVVNSAGGIPTPPFNVTPGASGHYHYAVAMFAAGRVYLDAGCPDIVIN